MRTPISIRTAPMVAGGLALAAGLLAVPASPVGAQEGSAPPQATPPKVTPPGVSPTRLQGYRMSGIGLPWEVDVSRLPGRPLVLPPPIGVPVQGGDSASVGFPPAAGGAAADDPEGRGRGHLSGDSRPLRRSVVVVSGGGGDLHRVEVIHGGGGAQSPDVSGCVLVRIELSGGTVRTERVSLSRLGASGPDEARAALLRRMEETGVLSLTAVDGTGLSVPASLVRDLAAAPCRESR